MASIPAPRPRARSDVPRAVDGSRPAGDPRVISAPPGASLSLFDQVPAVYAFCREHLFRDDTDRILATLWPDGRPPAGSCLLELGCGPGFYARQIAARFPDLRVIGVDRSVAQLAGARTRLESTSITNCRFDLGDATQLPYPGDSVDAVIASRLLAAVDVPLQVIAEAHRVLRPGGRCFIAEPRSSIRAAMPIALMRVAGRLDAGWHRRPVPPTERVAVLDDQTFRVVIRSQPWSAVTDWVDGSYGYALLEKAGQTPGPVGRRP